MSSSSTALTRRIARELSRARRRRAGLPEPQLLVRSEPLDLNVSRGEAAMPFHVTSVGKLMTAVIIGQRVDAGEVTWKTPIAEILPSDIVDGLVVRDGVDHSQSITIDHLLTHTSGLGDAFSALNRGRGRVSPGILNSAHAVTRDDLLSMARELEPVGIPGERFTYSDPGFWVLGLVLEAISGMSLGALMHRDIFAPLRMQHSALHGWVYPDGGPSSGGELIAPLWLGGHEVSRARGLMTDWAAGGVVSTVDDLLAFQTALHVERSLCSAKSLRHLSRKRNRLRPGIEYGAGMMILDFAGFFPLLRGLGAPVGHGGASGTQLFWHPQSQTHVVMNFHASSEVAHAYRLHILIANALKRLAKDGGIAMVERIG